jgi:hypothetical protein
MDTGEWESEFDEARQRLLESKDFYTLRSRGHDLRNGVVLTSVSEVPFEMSLKCIHCRVAFWFQNAAWSTGGIARWQISNVSLKEAREPCDVLAAGFHH